MTLFSTSIQVYEFLLVLYLGIACGIMFYVAKNFFSFLKNKAKNFYINKKNNNNKNKKSLNLKFNLFFIKFLLFFIDFLLLLIFFSLLVLSFYTNFSFNLGQISIFHIPLWCLAFFIGEVFAKLVAKFLFCFYNVFRKRALKNNEK